MAARALSYRADIANGITTDGAGMAIRTFASSQWSRGASHFSGFTTTFPTREKIA